MSKESEKYTCCLCMETLVASKFHKSSSTFYSNGYLPICKSCFLRKFGQYAAEYHSTKKAMQRMCMAFDVYFEEDLFDACDTGEMTVVGKYFRKLNMAQYKDKTFGDSLDKNEILSGERKPVKEKRVAVIDQYGNEVDEKAKVNPKDIDKWGYGFDPDDYEILNSHYKYLKTANPNCDSNQEIFINDLCYTNMQKMKALRENRVDDYNKLTESYRKSFNQAGLKTTQDGMKTADDCWSTFVGIVSQYTPEEYYKDKEKYKDHDGLEEYYERLAVRPLKNIVLGTQERDNEYYVHEVDSDE